MKKQLWVCILILFVTLTARGQQYDHPVTVPLYFYGEANFITSSTFYFGYEIGAVTSAYGTYGSHVYSSLATGYVLPGKNYSITVNASAPNAVIAHFQPGPGYMVYINDKSTNQISGVGPYTFQVRVVAISDLVGGLAGKRGGQCSVFPEDKPIWYIGLGATRDGPYAGAVGFRANSITSDLYTLSALYFDAVDTPEVTVTRDPSTGYISRVDAPEVTLVMTALPGGTSYKIDVCPAGTTSPFMTYTVSSYPVSGGAGIRIDRVETDSIGTTTWSTVLQNVGSTWTLYGWRVATVGSPIDTSNAISTTVSGTTSTVMYGSGDGQIVKQKTYATVNGHNELVSETLGSGVTTPLVTSYTYYANTSGLGWPQAVQTKIQPNGVWNKYEYFNLTTDSRQGLVQRIYRPWLDTPTTPAAATFSNCYVETFDYTTSYDGTTTAPALRATTINGTAVGETLWSYSWGYTTANSHLVAQTIQKDYSSSGSYLTTTTLSYRPDDGTSFFRGRNHSVTHPDNTKESYAYYFGTWDGTSFSADTAGADRLILTFHGQAYAPGTSVTSWSWSTGTLATWSLDPIYLIANLSTIDETVIDKHGRIVFNGSNIYTGGSSMELIAGTALTFNANNLLSNEKDVIRSVSGNANGDVLIAHSYSGGLEIGRTAIDGIQTTWHYDAWLRNDVTTTGVGGPADYPAKVQNFTYYGSDLVKTSQDTPTVTTTYTYDSAGRRTKSSVPWPGGGTLDTIYSYPSIVQTTVTLSTNATKTTDYYLDGRVKDEIGSGQVDTRYSYALEAGSTGNIEKTMQHGGTQANGWLETTTDWLGRTIIERSPQVGGTNKTRKNYNYNGSTGKLDSIMVKNDSANTRLLPDHFYIYGNLGMLTQEADDVNANGIIEPASSDRILLYSTSFYKDMAAYQGWIRHDNVQTYYVYGSSSGLATVSDRYTRYTRFNAGGMVNGTARVLSDVVTIDPSGRADTTWTWADATNQTQQKYYSIYGAGNASLTTWKNGYFQTDQSISGVIKTYKYNSAQCLVSSIVEATTNASISYTYTSGTTYPYQLVSSTGSGTTSTTTTYGYTSDAANNSQIISTTDSSGGVAYTEANALGLPWRSWGSAMQPSLIGYDGYGHKTSLTTWENPPLGTFTGSAWPSSPPAGNTVTWTLDAATGVAMSKVFANGTHVDFSYTALGKLRTRTWARGVVTTYDYWDGASGIDLTGELRQVSYSDSTPAWSMSNTRWGAPWSITDVAGTRVLSYNSDLKLNNESLGVFYGSKTLSSTYDSYGRSTGYTFNGDSTISASLTYDDTATGRLKTVSGTFGTTPVFTLSYAGGTDWVDTATCGYYKRYTPLVSQYDVIASATTSWNNVTMGQFTASYGDSRGWRDGQDNGLAAGMPAGSWPKYLGLGDGVHATFAYDGYGELNSVPTPTWLNTAGSQNLSNRNYGWTYDLAGNRATETGAAPTAYFTSPDNAANKAYGALNEYTSITGTLAEGILKYDEDGNLTQDGTWTYTYDGENRIKTMTAGTNSMSFLYDYVGRRIAKTVNGATTTYLYYDWKLAAQMNSTGYGIQKTFIWGPDFSDASHAAGGAGSLLAQIDVGGTVSCALPDSFGNIVGYLNSSGSMVAANEFTPFGRIINTAGAVASYPFGYSGQYTDAESGLVYYGMRYYNPKHGRFINRDPIEEVGGNNLFAFVGNNPVGRCDSLGQGDPPTIVVQFDDSHRDPTGEMSYRQVIIDSNGITSVNTYFGPYTPDTPATFHNDYNFRYDGNTYITGANGFTTINPGYDGFMAAAPGGQTPAKPVVLPDLSKAKFGSIVFDDSPADFIAQATAAFNGGPLFGDAPNILSPSTYFSAGYSVSATGFLGAYGLSLGASASMVAPNGPGDYAYVQLGVSVIPLTGAGGAFYVGAGPQFGVGGKPKVGYSHTAIDHYEGGLGLGAVASAAVDWDSSSSSYQVSPMTSFDMWKPKLGGGAAAYVAKGNNNTFQVTIPMSTDPNYFYPAGVTMFGFMPPPPPPPAAPPPPGTKT